MLAVVVAGYGHAVVTAGPGGAAVTAQAGGAAVAGASHPAVAVWFALGAAALAAAVVVMAWSVNARQIRLAELLVRRQFLVIAEAGAAGHALDEGADPEVAGAEIDGDGRTKAAQPAVIEGPDNVVTGEQARYRVRSWRPQQVVSWAVGGGSVSQSPDPAHPDELLLIADQPGQLTLTARVREGLSERRETKTVTAVPDVATATPPLTLRLFLHGWGLVVVAILIVGFAGALDALGNFTSSDFIALVVPLAALLGVIAVVRGTADAGNDHPGHGKGHGQI
ncbi:MAG: hypothetical protein M3Z75_18440 [Actinomycetota bacterium]|nr:hypothetical protein [Actinomycetota bacterium]